MPIFKCKMCGGQLEVSEGMTVCECEYCGTQQTLPKNHDDVLTNLFNRANNLRMKSEFDKAQEIYEKIVANNATESEAYWGIVLCKYGIEYVEDPATLKKIPTCHRTQLESVMTDVDYQAALDNSDTLQRSIYEREAAAIDKLQKDILAIVHKEQPFDVFICYKESDENGKRTPDSVIANDIYHQLTQEGFKVFYAAITLEDKLGQEYEPYIFAALSSAKVMLCIGTRPEYFNTVWVKNEWSRYLKLMKSDRSRLLIPCYKDMDAYDLPEEFSHLQAQDMGKIGFINDVIRGIKKVIDKDEPKQQTVVKETVVQTASSNTAPLLKRAALFLEDSDWTSANEYCNKVLDQDPECAQAYFYMLLAELRCSSEKALVNMSYENGISGSKNYKSAVRFGDDEFKAHLEELNNQTMYNYAENALKEADNRSRCMTAKVVYEKIKDFKDSAEKIEQCDEKANEIDYSAALCKMRYAREVQDYNTAASKFEVLRNYKDSAEKAKECRQKAKEAFNNDTYNQAIKILRNATNRDSCMEAKSVFEKIGWFKDSAEKIRQCDEKANEIDYNHALDKLNKATDRSACMEARVLFEKIVDYKDSIDKITQCRNKANEMEYANALENMDKAQYYCFRLEDKYDCYEKAQKIFSSLGGYKDSREKAEECHKKYTELREQNIERLDRELERLRKKRRNREIREKIIKVIKIILVIAAIIGVLAFLKLSATTFGIMKDNGQLVRLMTHLNNMTSEIFGKCGVPYAIADNWI